MSDKIIPITGKVDSEVQADRDQAIELARQVQSGEVETMPFIVADELKTMGEVIAYVREIQDDDELATVVAMLENAHVAAVRIMEEELRK